MTEQRILSSFKRSDVPRNLLIGPSIKHLYFYAAIDWAIILCSIYCIVNGPVVLYPLWLLLIGGRLHAFGVIIHDLSHLNQKNKKMSHRFLEILVGYPIGTTINAMAYHHLRHHRHTLMENDPYYNINKKCSTSKRVLLTFKKGLFFVPFWITRSFVGAFAYYLPSLRNFYGRTFLQDVSGEDLSISSEIITCAKEDRYLALFHLLLLGITFEFPLLVWIYYVALPVGGIFCIYRLLIEHEYDIVDNRSVYTMIETTFDHHMGLFGELLFAPRNIGYHCMHHIHPHVGLHKLPELRDWYLKNCPAYRLRYDEGKRGHLIDSFQYILKRGI